MIIGGYEPKAIITVVLRVVSVRPASVKSIVVRQRNMVDTLPALKSAYQEWLANYPDAKATLYKHMDMIDALPHIPMKIMRAHGFTVVRAECLHYDVTTWDSEAKQGTVWGKGGHVNEYNFQKEITLSKEEFGI